MWRNKARDLKMIEGFIEHLKEFILLKEERWEKIDDKVQMDNRLGSPSEDWIVPPDENQTLEELKKDPDYLRLRGELTRDIQHLKKIASFVHFNTHHDFDWVNFITPLVGNDALEDALKLADKLLHKCNTAGYVILNLKQLVRLTD